MDVALHEDGCGGCPECCGPAEFVRLRYYFGQRLGVMELTEAQSYVVGKQRFHNLRLHGVGVVCGLTADRFVYPQTAPAGTPTTILRVSRGAALDACGREVVVGGDQCIDVAAWFARQRSRADLKDWKAGEKHSLWVGLRYHECPSDPAPAPREPCGCDAGGCEFGRIREGFRLALLTEQEQKDACLGTPFPAPAAVRAALNALAAEDRPAGGSAREQLEQALGTLVAAACPDATCDGWLCLAKFDVTLTDQNGTPVVTDISTPDNAIPTRHALLNTSTLQGLAADLAAVAADEGLIGPGPAVGPLSFTAASGGNPDTLRLAVHLVSEGTPPAPTPLVDKTFQAAFVKLMQFDANANPPWQDVTPPAGNISYSNTASPAIILKFAGSAKEGHYRLTLAAPLETPVVDMKMRPLHPARLARQFRLVKDATGTLTLADTLF
jgi:hypothetical protein